MSRLIKTKLAYTLNIIRAGLKGSREQHLKVPTPSHQCFQGSSDTGGSGR